MKNNFWNWLRPLGFCNTYRFTVEIVQSWGSNECLCNPDLWYAPNAGFRSVIDPSTLIRVCITSDSSWDRSCAHPIGLTRWSSNSFPHFWPSNSTYVHVLEPFDQIVCLKCKAIKMQILQLFLAWKFKYLVVIRIFVELAFS